MYPTPDEINRHHQIVLDALHRAGGAWLNATRDLTLAGTRFVRLSLSPAGAQTGADIPPYALLHEHLAGMRSEAGATLGHGVKVTQRLIADLVDAADIQRQHLDALIVAGLERSARMLPDQLAHVVHGAEHTLLTAEHTAEDVSRAGLRSMRRAAAAVKDTVQPAKPAPTRHTATKRRPAAGSRDTAAASAKRSRG